MVIFSPLKASQAFHYRRSPVLLLSDDFAEYLHEAPSERNGPFRDPSKTKTKVIIELSKEDGKAKEKQPGNKKTPPLFFFNPFPHNPVFKQP